MTAATSLLAPRRAHQVNLGSAQARTLMASLFPPRPEDHDQHLSMTGVEVLTNQVLRDGVVSRTDPDVRRWWLEGLVVGFAQEAVDVLTRAADVCDYSAAERLTDMAEHVHDTLDADQQEASRLVFDLALALEADDPVGLSFTLEDIFRPLAGDADAATTLARYRLALVAALNIACASWRLLILLDEHPAE